MDWRRWVRRLIVCGLATLTLGAPPATVGAVPAPRPPDVAAPQATDRQARPSAGALERELFALLNRDRRAHGLSPLGLDGDARRVARRRALAQVQDGAPLSHYDAQGQLAFVALLARAGLPYARASENLVRGGSLYPGITRDMQEALMRSPGHRAAILDPGYTLVAVGVARGRSGRVAAAQIFRSAWTPGVAHAQQQAAADSEGAEHHEPTG
jgi:uncharacterized protein YkwD